MVTRRGHKKGFSNAGDSLFLYLGGGYLNVYLVNIYCLVYLRCVFFSVYMLQFKTKKGSVCGGGEALAQKNKVRKKNQVIE